MVQLGLTVHIPGDDKGDHTGRDFLGWHLVGNSAAGTRNRSNIAFLAKDLQRFSQGGTLNAVFFTEFSFGRKDLPVRKASGFYLVFQVFKDLLVL